MCVVCPHFLDGIPGCPDRDHFPYLRSQTRISDEISPSLTATATMVTIVFIGCFFLFAVQSAFSLFQQHPTSRHFSGEISSRKSIILQASPSKNSIPENNNKNSNMSSNPLKRRILVTGANTGIGLALTKQLVADYGCHVYLGSRNAERGAKAVEEVKASAGESVELLTIVSYFDCILVSIFCRNLWEFREILRHPHL